MTYVRDNEYTCVNQNEWMQLERTPGLFRRGNAQIEGSFRVSFHGVSPFHIHHGRKVSKNARPENDSLSINIDRSVVAFSVLSNCLNESRKFFHSLTRTDVGARRLNNNDLKRSKSK